MLHRLAKGEGQIPHPYVLCICPAHFVRVSMFYAPRVWGYIERGVGRCRA